MSNPSDPTLQDRLSSAADARRAMLAKFKQATDPANPVAIEKQRQREAIVAARAERAEQREAARQEQERELARQAALAAEAAEQAELEAALKAEQKAERDRRYAARKAAKKERRRGY